MAFPPSSIVLMIGFDDVKIMSWNIRGAMNEDGRRFVKDTVRYRKPDIIIIVEPRCQFNRVRSFWTSLGFTLQFISEATGFSGGIWVLSNEASNLSFRLWDMHSQIVSFEIWRANFSWICSAVYASPIPTNREVLWQHLAGLRGNISLPWLLVGDWNEVLHPHEVRGGDFLPNRALRFASALEDCNLVDLGMAGGNFTWFRKVNHVLILSKKLDRALCDTDWQVAFPGANVEVLNRIHSDHTPLMIHCGSSLHGSYPRPFRFMAAWMEHENYRSLVSNAWNRGSDNVQSKLSSVQVDSIAFNKDVFGDIFRRKRRIEARLKGAQRELNVRVTSDLVMFEADMQREYKSILKQEELLWFQKSRDNRVKFGDRNTAYFHAQTMIRRKRNTIHRLKLDNGEWCSDGNRLRAEVLNYFQSLFGARIDMNGAVLNHLRFPRLSEAAATCLGDTVDKEEVRQALMSMKSFTAPGPDGFQPVFFKKYWDLVGEDVWRLVRDAFATGTVDASIMETLIVLIPKVDHPATIKEFRPISLCNVVYKLITKVMVGRIRPFLDGIISPMQNSFLPGRGTMDNAFLAQEIIHHMNNSRVKKGSLAFKIDLEKAYDSVSWTFLEETLTLFGFPPRIIQLIMCCVSSSSLSILWNGERLPAFHPGRGLRQGDPLSPYLFVLCMERLSVYIQSLVEENSWQPVRLSPDGPPISHLFFADDVLLFCKASGAQVQLVAEALKLFCDSSGLRINMAKSKAIASRGVSQAIRNEVRNIAPIPFVHNLGKYLGFPLHGGRRDRNAFQYLLDNIQRKLASWKTNMLNFAGRVCLAKSVLAAIPTYSMQVFWLPRWLNERINQLVRNFIWSRHGGNRGWHLVNWDTLTRDKDCGGLGIKEMNRFNTALLGKAVWQLVQKPNKLWVKVLDQKYIKDSSILSVQPRQKDSPLWKGILRARDQVGQQMVFRIGNGETSLWYKDWSGTGPIAHQLPFVNIADVHLQLKDIIQGNVWDLNRLYTMIPLSVQQKLTDLQPTVCVARSDGWVWNVGNKGQYTVRDGYAWLNGCAHDQQGDRKIDWVWKLKVPEKVRVFVWLVLHNAIQVNQLRARCHMAADATCTRCSNSIEDALHCLRDCPQSWDLWQRLGATNWANFRCSELERWVTSLSRGVHGVRFLAGLWAAWKWRCNLLLDAHPWPFEVAWRRLSHDHDDWIRSSQEVDLLLCNAWSPPPTNMVKCNSDGSFCDSNQRIGGGGIIRDHLGRWVVGCYSGEAGDSAFRAEAVAMRDVLQLAWEKGFRRVICDVDCAELASIITDEAASQRHAEFLVLGSIRQLLAREWNVRINCVHRESNIVADYLARRGAAARSSGAWVIESPDPDVEYLLLKDSLSIL
ncbi:uncharacterized protein LOC130734042 [Lotus japonicus]|uniref:uncharacterized protein LOC130734042 n=1 Tax=Lotus japonicus TaxID=34305 RepID=UPI00258D5BDF|nr:uncharacterized protein LOC130734042 [Lotus japonicus]